MAGFIHTSGYATEDLYPRSYNASAKNNLNAAPEYFNPYYACTIIILLTASDPNSGPSVFHIFSRQYAVIYAFCILHASVDKPFSAAIFRSILMVSLETTDEYVMDEGDAVV